MYSAQVPMNNALVLGGYLTTLPLKVFTQRNFVADFLREKPILYEKLSLCVFEAPFGGLGATYAVHLRLDWKARSRLPISHSETFFAIGAFVLSQFTHLTEWTDGRTDGRTDRRTDAHGKTADA